MIRIGLGRNRRKLLKHITRGVQALTYRLSCWYQESQQTFLQSHEVKALSGARRSQFLQSKSRRRPHIQHQTSYQIWIIVQKILMSYQLLTIIWYGYYKKNNKFYFKSSSQVHIIMGGGQSRAQMIKRFNKINPHKWNTVRKEGLTEIAVDQDGREGQVNVVNYDPRNKLEEELEVYFFRRHFNAPIVKCYGAEPINNDSIGFCGVQNTLKVITERIVKRWSQLPQLTFPQSIYSLRQALLGYKTLFKEVGAFEVNHNMLGLNKSGDLHVWLSENFAENKPRLQKGILYTTESLDTLQKVDTEPEMVLNIINLIGQKCQQGKFPADFRDLVGNSSQSFQNCLDQIQAYIDARKMLIPSKIHLDNDKMYLKSVKRVQQPPKNLSGSGFKITDQKKWQPSPYKLYFDQIAAGPKRQASPLTTPKHISLISPGLSGSRSLKKNIPSPSSNTKQVQGTSPIKYISPVGYLSTTGPTSTNNYTFNPKNQSNGEGYKKNITFGSSDQISINARYNDLKMNPNINAAQSVYDRSPNASFLLTDKIGDAKIDGPSTHIISGSGPGNTGFTTYTGTQAVNYKLDSYKDTILQGSGSKPNTNIKFNYQPSSLEQPGKQISSNTFTSNTYGYLPKTTDYQIQGTTTTTTTTGLGTKSYTTTTPGYTAGEYTTGGYATGGYATGGYATGPTTGGFTTFAPSAPYPDQENDKIKLQIQTSQVTKQY